MPPTLEMTYHKWESSLLTSALLHTFILVKVKSGRFHRVDFFTYCKILFFSFKNGIAKVKVGIIEAIDKLTV